MDKDAKISDLFTLLHYYIFFKSALHQNKFTLKSSIRLQVLMLCKPAYNLSVEK